MVVDKYHNVTDGQTDRQTESLWLFLAIAALCIASNADAL